MKLLFLMFNLVSYFCHPLHLIIYEHENYTGSYDYYYYFKIVQSNDVSI